MILSSIFAAAHYLALGIGLGSIFMRGRYLRALLTSPQAKEETKKELRNLFIADNF